MTGGFTNYFTGAPRVSSGKKVLLVILGILLALSLLVLGPVMALHQTVFNPDCIASYVDDIDVPAIAQGWLNTYVAPKNPLVAKSAELVIVNFEPQIKEGLKTGVRDTYSFLLNRLENGKLLETIAAQKPLVDNLAANVQAVLGIPVLNTLLETLGVNADSIAKSIDIKQINGYFNMLAQLAALQSVIVFIHASFVPAIILALALLIAIILIARKPGFLSGELGFILAICGVLQFVFVLPLDGSMKSALAHFNLPALLHGWLVRLVGDYTNIVMIYGGVLLLCGVVLIVLYYVFKPGTASPKAA
ncbi:MAG: hypothetical protein NT177_08265 [Chloroflexi bacterium]|nr:hypothetical protein [Chloroflexota bacterium]